MSLQEILRQRLRIWIPFLLIISSVFSLLGCIALGVAPFVIFSNFLFSICNTYLCVGLAVGLGAYFANFEWEHSGQLAASVGSFIFMLVSVGFSAVNAALTFSLFKLDISKVTEHVDPVTGLTLLVCLLAIPLISIMLVRTVLQMGEAALKRSL